jgi:hypothetical protein
LKDGGFIVCVKIDLRLSFVFVPGQSWVGLWHRLQQLQADGATGAMTMVGYEQQPYEYISIYTTGFNLVMCSILHYE